MNLAWVYISTDSLFLDMVKLFVRLGPGAPPPPRSASPLPFTARPGDRRPLLGTARGQTREGAPCRPTAHLCRQLPPVRLPFTGHGQTQPLPAIPGRACWPAPWWAGHRPQDQQRGRPGAAGTRRAAGWHVVRHTQLLAPRLPRPCRHSRASWTNQTKPKPKR